MDIQKGDRVRITMPAQGPFPAGWAEGAVLTARKDPEGWFIELSKDKVSPGWELGYGYWKQGNDGGTVEKLTCSIQGCQTVLHEEKDLDSRYCPKCHQLFAIHNDDGSCVEDS